ncbi:phenylacetate--CoA ligase family protein [Hyunsoonleella pacifica]|uniref:Phenylacetate--CoA ligase family protein n=1 Tax=Hyunsoonleella pacifica TaxID=1080224 RepID=A0A4Q9FPR1_9FLAO|nr:phenylacetate--CoA ligase family protein [Hyunsoonleella pacifica]TBN16745.1 phenylacetate--CoA ligase family protein [Hyunsoonleella pacifica]GGD16779.1 AMP-binding protein [Hyunsoonleella pacifica]
MNLFNLTLKLKGFPIEKAKRDLIAIQSKTEAEHKIYLNSRKQAIVAHHLNHNIFYKEFVRGIDTNDWNTLPIIKKSDLQIPLKHRLSNGFTAKNCHIHKTSGSSGTPLIFVKDKYTHAMSWANFMDRYSWYGIDAAASKQARFYGIPLNGMGYYKERFKDFLGNRFRFSVFDLSDTQLEHNVKKFKSTPFEYINGYTSAIVQFAKFLKKKSVVLKDICPSLKVCIVTAEMLFEDDKVLLEKHLGVPIVNEYGSAELSLIAFSSLDNEWIVNTEDLYIEILDENDKPLPNGKEGRIVVSSLYNLAHPFIRYDLGDIGVLSESSTTKKPVLKHVTGRTSDIAILPSGKKVAGLTFYYITKTVIEDNMNVKEFIIEQHKLNTFKIIYSSKVELSNEKLATIEASITNYLEPGLAIYFERKQELKRTKGGKLKQFTSFVKE